jgi:hypothetical protein
MAENAQAVGAIVDVTEHDIDNDFVLDANAIINVDDGSEAPEMAQWFTGLHLLPVLKRLSRNNA